MRIIIPSSMKIRVVGGLLAVFSIGIAFYNIVVTLESNQFSAALEPPAANAGFFEPNHGTHYYSRYNEINQERKQEQHTKAAAEQELPEWRREDFVWDQLIKRARSMNQECKNISHDMQRPLEVNKYTNVSLSPFGVATDVSADPGTVDWPVCSLPPEKSCNVTKYSVIFMSHTVHRLQEMSGGIKGLMKGSSERIQEIILVWNNERTVLAGNALGQIYLNNHNDTAHPLRIFFSVEEGLGNNLLNRYHPKVNPVSAAILYYDDDGPFWSAFAIESGFQLWRRSSQQQVGAMARNLVLYKKDFPADMPPRYYALPKEMRNRIQQKRDDEMKVHLKQVLHSWHSVNAYDEVGTKSFVQKIGESARHPEFTPHCGPSAGQYLLYNFYSFAQFDAHVALPSGSFLSREYLCWLWHPRLKKIREFVLEHPTHPDDMYTSILVSHLSGKSPRVYPFRLRFGTRRRLVETSSKNETSTYAGLWTSQNWGMMREEAMNTIVEYFGSLGPGSVGWCAGTELYIEKGTTCPDNKRPHADTIPWMHEGGLGYDECPIDEGYARTQ